ncbi:MAG: hypothetical protein CMM41_12685 [Rhodospirillaceae bacterium]|nr:hypothetical protein [Rhodospirillaceae bacterium]|tara:strand:- start:1143 stop:2024 length:882 start_codon:yes stop_codon:yes gene_type:complete
MGKEFDRREEDIANFVGLEHTNVRVPDQRLATIFYVEGMGFTRDPYMVPGVKNMWMNIGRTQIHLPTGKAQVIPGCTGIVVPDIKALRSRLKAVEKELKGTKYAFSIGRNRIDVTCPWGNKYSCFPPNKKFGRITLGIRYVELDCRPGTADGIAKFYNVIMGAKAGVRRSGGVAAHVHAGSHQWIIFRETNTKIPRFDGHHIQVYLANFSAPHAALKEIGLVSEESNRYQYRFKHIVDLQNGKKLHTLEHEIRSMTHPLYGRPMINRNPNQHNNNYAAGHSDRAFMLEGEELR